MDALQSFLADSVAPYKCQMVPEKSDGPVTVAVSENFEAVVTNNG